MCVGEEQMQCDLTVGLALLNAHVSNWALLEMVNDKSGSNKDVSYDVLRG